MMVTGPSSPLLWNFPQTDMFIFLQPYTVKERETLSRYLGNKNFEPILNSPRLFWLLFCTAFDTFQRSQGVSWSCDNEQFSCQTKGSLNEFLHSSLERIRRDLLDGYNVKRPVILFPANWSILYGTEGETFVLSLSLDPVSQALIADFSAIHPSEGLPDYSSTFLPSFAILVQSLEGEISKQPVAPVITHCWWANSNATPPGQEALFINFTKVQAPYPSLRLIPPRTVETEQKNRYQLYQTELFCDTVLHADDGELKMHATALYLYSGEMIKEILTDPRQDSATKIIRLHGFSRKTVSAFADFIYLGAETVEQNQSHVFELLRLAHYYQIKILTDCCTNVISLGASTDQAELIDTLAARYENAHLRELHKYLIGMEK